MTRKSILVLLAVLAISASAVAADAEGELASDQIIVVRYYAGDVLAKTLTVTPKGQTLWTINDEAAAKKIDSARAFLVKGKKETPISAAAAFSPTGLAGEYHIGPEDVLDVNVWDNQQVSKIVPVRPDGMISLPLLGDIRAAGYTAAELRERISTELRRFVGNPEVTVTITAINSYKVFVQGRVTHPGAYPISGAATITHAVSLAGGFTEFADPNGIVILRSGAANQAPNKIKVKYNRILNGKDIDIRLMPGDTIVVP